MDTGGTPRRGRDAPGLRIERVLSDGQVRHGAKTRGSVAKCRCRAGRSTRSTATDEAGHAAAVPDHGRPTAEPDHLAASRVDARRRGRRYARPARIYDLRSTFASNALAAGVTLFELARIMGTSVRMIERSYGTLLGGAHAGIAGRLDALEAELEQAAEAEAR